MATFSAIYYDANITWSGIYIIVNPLPAQGSARHYFNIRYIIQLINTLPCIMGLLMYNRAYFHYFINTYIRH